VISAPKTIKKKLSANKATRRKTVATGAAISLLLTAGGLSGNVDNYALSAAQSGAPHVTLSYLSLFGTGVMYKIQQEAATEFERAHPGVTVKLLTAPSGTTFAKFQTLAAAGSAPDVYMSQAQWAGELLAHDVLAPVDYKALGFKNAAQFASTYIPNALTPYISKGVLYGVPEEISNYQNWVNIADFKRAGLPVPLTWQQVCADGPKLTVTAGGKITQEEVALPTGLPGAQYLVLNSIAMEYGKPLFNLAGTVSYLTSGPVVSALTMLQQLVYKCHAAYPALNGGTHGAGRSVYTANKAAMMLTGGSWFYGLVIKPANPKLLAVSRPYPYPAPAGRASTSTSYGYAWVVTRSLNQRLAWEFVRTLRSQAPLVFKAIGLPDGEKTIGSTPAAAAAVPFWRSVWLPSLAKAHPQSALVNSSQIDDIISKAMDQVLESDANVRATLAAANQEVLPLLNKP
jgi:ABC-type glycerol-3-phosphate transport system substrate-binding protein